MSGTKDCVYFITPVHERYEITAISLRQKVDAIEKLAKEGIDAQCVVVGDDDNIPYAKSLGLATVVRDNDYLGRKFNDGHQYAAKHGATHTAPVGSDSWMDPTFMFDSLPHSAAILVSKHYAIVHKTGLKRCQLLIPYVSYVVPTKLMEGCDWRPILETRPKGCDTNTFQTIDDLNGGPVRKLVSKNSHELDTVAFQSPTQITDYDRIRGRWGVSETYDAFGDLKTCYPTELVGEVEQFYNLNNETISYDLLERCIPFVRKIGGGRSHDLQLEIEACLIRKERDELENESTTITVNTD